MKLASVSAHGLQNNFLSPGPHGSTNYCSYIARENPDAALRVGNSLIKKVAILENFPLLGSPYAKRREIRFLVSRPYIIFYRFRAKENYLDILRYWHAARGEPNL
jgi:plasmid stabilization system protein ParE